MQAKLDRIHEILRLTRDESTETRLTYLMEESGELSRAQRNYRNKDGDPATLQEQRLEEAVDVVITGLAAFVTVGGTEMDLERYFWQKCFKWEENERKKLK